MSDTYIWRDVNDKDQYIIGVDTSGNPRRPRYVAWLYCFHDGFRDLFGPGLHAQLKQVPTDGEPVPIVLTLRLIDGD